MQASSNEPQFNSDLLAHPEDLVTARELYPRVGDALYHPELIDYFKKFDEQANIAKRRSRRLGTEAILLGAAAALLRAVAIILPAVPALPLAVLGRRRPFGARVC